MSLDDALRCYMQGDLAGAEARCAALGGPEAWHLRGLVAYRRGALPEAAGWLRRALAVREDPLWRANLGAVLLAADAYAEAAVALRAALAGDPAQQEALGNLSAALLYLDDPEGALAAADAAVALDPAFATGHTNRGTALQELGHLTAARVAFAEAIRLDPGDREARMNQGILSLLVDGLAQEGAWADYEARLTPEDLAGRPPLWTGAPLDPRTDRLLLFAEQGLGDTLQFCRYAALLAEAGVPVTLEVPGVLLPLLERCGLSARVAICAAEAAQAERFTCSLPLLSLPRVLGAARTLRTAWRGGPYLHAEPARVARWRQRLGIGRGWGAGEQVVAVAWQGNPDSAADRGRSFPLEALRPLAEVPGVRLVSVQRGAGSEQAEGVEWIEVLPGLDAGGAFLDTAAVMAAASLVVTADTATAHLAGALGRPVWVALRAVPDWRWGMQGEETVWYPSARLVRQHTRGDWAPVFAVLAERLSRRGRFRVRLRC